MSSACSIGVAGSSAPATTSTGAVIAEIRSRTSDDGVCDGLHPIGADGSRSLRPRLGRAEVRRCAGEDEPLDALRHLERECHPHHPSERDAAEGDPADVELVEELDESVCQRLDRAWPLGKVGRAVAGVVVGEDVEVLRQLGELPIPQFLRGAERVGQDENVPAGSPLEAVLEAHPRVLSYSPSARSTSASAAPR